MMLYRKKKGGTENDVRGAEGETQTHDLLITCDKHET